MEEKRSIKTVKSDVIHNIIMENRKKVSVSGVDGAVPSRKAA